MKFHEYVVVDIENCEKQSVYLHELVVKSAYALYSLDVLYLCDLTEYVVVEPPRASGKICVCTVRSVRSLLV